MLRDIPFRWAGFIGRAELVAVQDPESMNTKQKLEPWIETGIRASASEIQRRIIQRGCAISDLRGDRHPAMTTEEMCKIIREFLLSSQEGLG